MNRETLVRKAFAEQSGWCAKLGSPFTALLMDGLGRSLGLDTITGRRILEWQGEPNALGDAVPLRLAGALHAFVRRGRFPDLAKLYPPNPLPTKDALMKAAIEAIADADTEIEAWLAYAPQTNEVGRSAVLYPGFMFLAEKTGLPLNLYELGSSAGLNLIPDKYSYKFEDEHYGMENSSVPLSPKWSGPRPANIQPQILQRRGCDRNPLDVNDAKHRERLIAYIWPDQPDRISRVQGAIDLATNNTIKIDAADAADWVEVTINVGEETGVVQVLFHSIAYQYFPIDTKNRIQCRMDALGKQASAAAPLAWLTFEQYQYDGPRLTLRLWPDGGEQVLALADAHARSINWVGVN